MRWGRAVVGGVLAEAMLIVVVAPGGIMGNEAVVTWSAVIGAPIVTFLAALWVCRGIGSQFVLDGTLTGLAAMLIYLIPVLAGGIAQPLVYWVAHGLKVGGGAAGGMFVARRVANTGPVVRAGT
jgi:hypothetical protein